MNIIYIVKNYYDIIHNIIFNFFYNKKKKRGKFAHEKKNGEKGFLKLKCEC